MNRAIKLLKKGIVAQQIIIGRVKKMHEGVEYHPTSKKFLEAKEQEIQEIEKAIKILKEHKEK